jgi:hypothetical protein
MLVNDDASLLALRYVTLLQVSRLSQQHGQILVVF